MLNDGRGMVLWMGLVGLSAWLVLDSHMITSSGRSRPGHKVSGTWPKFPNLNENGQKSDFHYRFCFIQNPVKVFPKSATDIIASV